MTGVNMSRSRRRLRPRTGSTTTSTGGGSHVTRTTFRPCRHPRVPHRDRQLRPPDGGTRLDLSSFVRPDHEPGSPAARANELGLRNVAFEVDDLQAAVDGLAGDGYGLVGGIGQYERSWRDGLRARSGGDHRVLGRTDRLTHRWTSALAAHSELVGSFDATREHSPAEYVRRLRAPAESPTRGLAHLQLEALLTGAKAVDQPLRKSHSSPCRGSSAYGSSRPPAATSSVELPRMHPHMLRHTFVTPMLDAGVDRHPNSLLAAYVASGT